MYVYGATSPPDRLLRAGLRVLVVALAPVCSGPRADYIIGFGPFLAALIVLALIRGKVGVLGLLRRMVRWRVNSVW